MWNDMASHIKKQLQIVKEAKGNKQLDKEVWEGNGYLQTTIQAKKSHIKIDQIIRPRKTIETIRL